MQVRWKTPHTHQILIQNSNEKYYTQNPDVDVPIIKRTWINTAGKLKDGKLKDANLDTFWGDVKKVWKSKATKVILGTTPKGFGGWAGKIAITAWDVSGVVSPNVF